MNPRRSFPTKLEWAPSRLGQGSGRQGREYEVSLGWTWHEGNSVPQGVAAGQESQGFLATAGGNIWYLQTVETPFQAVSALSPSTTSPLPWRTVGTASPLG